MHGTGGTRARAGSGFRRIEGQRRRVKIQRKTLAREPQGAGWGNRAGAKSRVLAPRLSALMRTRNNLRQGMTPRECPRTPKQSASPRDSRAPAGTLARSPRGLGNDTAGGY